MPSTFNSPAPPVHSYKLATHSASDAMLTASATSMQGETVSPISKPDSGHISDGMDEIIRRGRWGLDGLVNFAMYFVEQRGVSGGLFEGKLTYLVMALKKR